MKRLLSFSKNAILKLVYSICCAYIVFYFKYYDYPYVNDVEDLISELDNLS